MNRLRDKGDASPDQLIELTNGYVSASGTVESRPGTTLFANLDPPVPPLLSILGSAHLNNSPTDDFNRISFYRQQEVGGFDYIPGAPASINNNEASGIAFSKDGKFVAAAHALTPFVSIYEISNDDITDFEQLPNPSTLPSSTGWSVAFSQASDMMAVGHTNSPRLTVYSITGSVFTKLDNPATIPPGNVNGVAFSPNGQFIACAHITSPRLSIYEVVGSTLTKLPNPGSLPYETAYSVAFSPDGTLLCVTFGNFSYNATPNFRLYQVSGSTFTIIPPPAVLPTWAVQSCAFSPDGRFLVLGVTVAPFLIVYDIDGTTFTKIPDPDVLPTSQAQAVAFSVDGRFLSVALFSPPYTLVYEIDGTTMTLVGTPSGLVGRTGRGMAFYPNSLYGPLV